MPADWLAEFLAGFESTTMTVVHRPVDPARSQRRIDSQLVKLGAHLARKEDRARRVTEVERRVQQAAEDLESEIASGFAETLYLGLVSVSGSTAEELDTRGHDLEQAARGSADPPRTPGHGVGGDAALRPRRPVRPRPGGTVMAGGTTTRLGVPWGRGSTAHTCSIYPFSVHRPLTAAGILVGIDMLSGDGFCWDPFEAYAEGLVSNPNVAIFGLPGQRKSTLVKTYLARMFALCRQRWVGITDPKGKYTALAEHLGLDVIRLLPGGETRVNPLAPGPPPGTSRPTRPRCAGPTTSPLVAAALQRELTPGEDAILYAAIAELLAGRTDEPTLADLAGLLADPTEAIAGRVRQPSDQVAADAVDLYYALSSLLGHSLRGMFDGTSTVDLAVDGRGVVLDLSGLDPSSRAMPLVLMAATAWLQEHMAAPGPQRVQVIDELWLGAGDRHFVRHVQRCQKLGRSFGTANLQVTRKVTDAAAQADDGRAESKIAAGLLADCDTKIVLRQDADQLAAAQQAFGLTDVERSWIGALAPGRALWLVGERRAVVQHHIAPHETTFCDTDQGMQSLSHGFRGTEGSSGRNPRVGVR